MVDITDDGASPEPTDGSPPPDPDTERLSDQLATWMAADGRRTIGELVDTFGPRSFAVAFVVLLAFPALPLPTGGLSHVLELAAMLVALELILGRSELWVPKRWRDKELKGLSGKGGQTLIRWIKRLERFARPRLSTLLDLSITRRVYGLLILGFSIAAFVSPPFSGLDTLPALGAVVLSVGFLLRDALIALIGVLIGAVGLGVILAIGQAIVRAF